MPFLKRHSEELSRAPASALGPASAIFKTASDRGYLPDLVAKCANSGCRTGWLHMFRHRSKPAFEGGWTCSPECTEASVLSALHRELDGRAPSRDTYRHRIPLGLLMLEKGWITGAQLREALRQQAAAGYGRLGEWLIKLHATDETIVTRALAMQWSCPVLLPDAHAIAAPALAMPRLFLDAFGALPMRISGRELLYLGFEQSIDSILAFAVGRMTGMRVECGIVSSTLFRPALDRTLQQDFPAVQLMEAVSESAAAHHLARSIERLRPVASRLVRVRDFIWLRMWLNSRSGPIPEISSISDVVCSIGAF